MMLANCDLVFVTCYARAQTDGNKTGLGYVSGSLSTWSPRCLDQEHFGFGHKSPANMCF